MQRLFQGLDVVSFWDVCVFGKFTFYGVICGLEIQVIRATVWFDFGFGVFFRFFLSCWLLVIGVLRCSGDRKVVNFYVFFIRRQASSLVIVKCSKCSFMFRILFFCGVKGRFQFYFFAGEGYRVLVWSRRDRFLRGRRGVELDISVGVFQIS